MKLPFYQIDAFATETFGGNPAAVMPLEAWLPDDVLQKIAIENNLSETAFFVETGGDSDYRLRWFTPGSEIDLCGHATLASAAVIFRHLRPDLDRVRFDSLSGPLAVTREGDELELDFPERAPVEIPVADEIVEALGVRPLRLLQSREPHAVLESADAVRQFVPDMTKIAAYHPDSIGITAAGDREGLDYVCRLFAPNAGIPEDPVTGSIQCTLAPYWAAQLGKAVLQGRQESARGGDFRVRIEGGRVYIAGRATFVIEGEFALATSAVPA
jgi:PhzF family phenazine biosynthesis protein